MPSKVQAVLLYFATPTTKIEAQCWMGFFGFWTQHFFFALGIIALSHRLDDAETC